MVWINDYYKGDTLLTVWPLPTLGINTPRCELGVDRGLCCKLVGWEQIRFPEVRTCEGIHTWWVLYLPPNLH